MGEIKIKWWQKCSSLTLGSCSPKLLHCTVAIKHGTISLLAITHSSVETWACYRAHHYWYKSLPSQYLNDLQSYEEIILIWKFLLQWIIVILGHLTVRHLDQDGNTLFTSQGSHVSLETVWFSGSLRVCNFTTDNIKVAISFTLELVKWHLGWILFTL